jgi:hypothetical protein
MQSNQDPARPRPLVGQISPRRFGLGPPEPPASIAEHITHTVSKIPNLTPKQRASVTAAMTEMCRDLSFVRHIMDQMPRAPMDQGRPL